uniref:Uncharacterized protein n=1 Tax=Timema bartmani TaxID=61472 RepID=A0A7R9F0U7_9NEOP|nr:unnamed protein product [Timema bartmani]
MSSWYEDEAGFKLGATVSEESLHESGNQIHTQDDHSFPNISQRILSVGGEQLSPWLRPCIKASLTPGRNDPVGEGLIKEERWFKGHSFNPRCLTVYENTSVFKLGSASYLRLREEMRTRSLNAPSPIQQFGPCGRIMKNSAMVIITISVERGGENHNNKSLVKNHPQLTEPIFGASSSTTIESYLLITRALARTLVSLAAPLCKS